MTKYKCGHETNEVILSTPKGNTLSGNTLSIMALSSYKIWSESTGYNGDNSECFKCWCDRHNTDIRFREAKEVLEGVQI